MMGTLFEQRPRFEQLSTPGYRIALMANELTDLFGISFKEALKCIELDHKINDYDVKDGQLAGFGELLRDYLEAKQNENPSN
ncbi:hypothetical protein [Streptococcus suis]|uniref:hypothetical protein n=1 Tax=Streptococcus suis TaxID=1307 RepID=UPI0019163172|nr:hypothetical protein [Streptococcus suis]